MIYVSSVCFVSKDVFWGKGVVVEFVEERPLWKKT